MSKGPIRFCIIAAEEGLTLRQLLPRRFGGLTKQQAGELVKAGGVYLNNVRIRIPSVLAARPTDCRSCLVTMVK